MGDFVESPGPLWRNGVKLPRDVSYYMKWDSIDNGELLALERAAIITMKKCDERIEFLTSAPQNFFGIAYANTKTTFIIPADIDMSVIDYGCKLISNNP